MFEFTGRPTCCKFINENIVLLATTAPNKLRAYTLDNRMVSEIEFENEIPLECQLDGNVMMLLTNKYIRLFKFDDILKFEQVYKSEDISMYRVHVKFAQNSLLIALNSKFVYTKEKTTLCKDIDGEIINLDILDGHLLVTTKDNVEVFTVTDNIKKIHGYLPIYFKNCESFKAAIWGGSAKELFIVYNDEFEGSDSTSTIAFIKNDKLHKNIKLDSLFKSIEYDNRYLHVVTKTGIEIHSIDPSFIMKVSDSVDNYDTVGFYVKMHGWVRRRKYIKFEDYDKLSKKVDITKVKSAVNVQYSDTMDFFNIIAVFFFAFLGLVMLRMFGLI